MSIVKVVRDGGERNSLLLSVSKGGSMVLAEEVRMILRVNSLVGVLGPCWGRCSLSSLVAAEKVRQMGMVFRGSFSLSSGLMRRERYSGRDWNTHHGSLRVSAGGTAGFQGVRP